MESIQDIHPLQLVHLDYLTIEVTEGGKNLHVLISTDHLNEVCTTLVTPSQTAKCTAQVLWD